MRSAKQLFFAIAFLLLFSPFTQAQSLDYGPLPQFELLDQSSRSVTLQTLKGRIWVANFIFTRCQGPCPVLSGQMAALQKKLPADVGLLSFTVDPEFDRPSVLQEYSRAFNALPGRWLFLTGAPSSVQDFLIPAFHLPAGVNAQSASEGDAFFHTLRFVLINEEGRVVGHYESTDPSEMGQLSKDALKLSRAARHPVASQLVHVNAGLNTLCTLLLLLGLVWIRAGRRQLHQAAMALAFCASILFLVCYLVYHHYMGSVAFQGAGAVRVVYFTILISHTVLAALVPAMALRTLFLAWKGRFEAHRRWARWTFPLWLYVSVTGVAVYWMLYWM